MKKTLLLIALLLSVVLTGYAQQRSEQQAIKIADSFLKSSPGLKTKSGGITDKSISLAYACGDKNNLRSSSAGAYYYVFNVNETDGFIIVSGDEKAADILGYADNGGFDIDNLPDNFRYWLSVYEGEMKELKSNPQDYVKTTPYATTAALSPLLGEIKWNQDSPYNDLCPVIPSTTTKVAAGCVATAMAQVMKYHQWPIKGIGSNSYTTETLKIPLSVDFSTTTYDWANMTPTYGATSTTAQNAAVATLVYHCGVATSMNYNRSSGTSDRSMAQALVNNFGYDKNLQLLDRDYYPIKEWNAIVKKELDAKRPVLYSGVSMDPSGHLFVCDGYDNAGLFHINWGWGGMSNGYFALSGLTPSAQGLGGSSGGYNIFQTIAVGVQKPTGASVATYQMLGNITSLPAPTQKETDFSLIFFIRNRGVNDFSGGAIGVALYDNNDNEVAFLKGWTFSLQSYYQGHVTLPGIKIPTSVTNGIYKLRFLYTASTTDQDWKVMVNKVGHADFANVTVSGTTATFSFADMPPQLKLNSLVAEGKLYNAKTGRFTANISNTSSTVELKSLLAIKMTPKTKADPIYISVQTPVNIAPGETQEVAFIDKLNVAPGEYTVSVVYDTANDQTLDPPNYAQYAQVGTTSYPMTVLATPVQNVVDVVLTAPISFPDNSNVTANTFDLRFNVKNNGDYFDNYIAAYVNTIGTNSYSRFDMQLVTLEPGETKTIHFTTAPDMSFGAQKIGAIYWTSASTNAWMTPDANCIVSFTYKADILSGVETSTSDEQAMVYPNPATDYINIESDEVVSSVLVYDLSGKQVLSIKPQTSGKITVPVQDLNNGTYILRWISTDGVKTHKFIKR